MGSLAFRYSIITFSMIPFFVVVVFLVFVTLRFFEDYIKYTVCTLWMACHSIVGPTDF